MMRRRSNKGLFQRLLEAGSRTTYQGKIRTRGGKRAGTIRQGKQSVYRGVRIVPIGDGTFETSLDSSRFDSLRDAKRFVDAWKKRGNPAIQVRPSSRFKGRWEVGVPGYPVATKKSKRGALSLARSIQKAQGGEIIELDVPAESRPLPAFLQGNPPGTKGRFERCVKAVSERGGAIDPRAVCGAQEKKYRKNRVYSEGQYTADKGQAELAAQYLKERGYTGVRIRKRKGPLSGGYFGPNQPVYYITHHGQLTASGKRNPADSAVEAYKIFHGREPEELITIAKQRHYHKHLAAAGELEALVIENDRYRVTLSKFKGALLAFNEQALPELARKGKVKLTQLFIEGGDQTVNLEDFGIDPENVHEIETLGKAVKIDYFTTKDHLGDEGGTATYGHKFRSTNKDGKHVTVKIAKYPDVIYRVRDNQLEFSGGSYEIRAEGIDK